MFGIGKAVRLLVTTTAKPVQAHVDRLKVADSDDDVADLDPLRARRIAMEAIQQANEQVCASDKCDGDLIVVEMSGYDEAVVHSEALRSQLETLAPEYGLHYIMVTTVNRLHFYVRTQ